MFGENGGTVSRKARAILSVIVAALVVSAGVFVGYTLLHRSRKTGSSSAQGLPVTGNILPDPVSLVFEGAYLEMWASYAPSQSGSLQVITEHNVSPILSTTVNSTGNVSALLPLTFLTIAQGWANYFSVGGQNGSETSFSVQVTYDYQINSSAMKVYSFSDFIPYNPQNVNASYKLNLSLHPNLAERPYLISVNGTPYSETQTGTLVPMLVNDSNAASTVANPSRICPPSGCGQCDQYVWYAWNGTSYNNADLPILWANNTGTAGNSILLPSVTIGVNYAKTGFNAGEGYHSSTTLSSNYISTGQSYTAANGTTGGNDGDVYSPLTNSTASFAYIWIEGNFTVTNYREAIYNTCNGQKTWLNNYETVPHVDSLEVQNHTFVMGMNYTGYNASNPYTNPQALAQLGLGSSMVTGYSSNLNVSQEAQWNEIYNTVTGNYSNIQGEINGFIGLGLAMISLVVTVAAASGWSPGSGWALIPSLILAITGLTAAALALIINGVVDASSTVFLYSGHYKNDGLPGSPGSGNSISLGVYAVNASISYNGNSYTFPVLYGTGS